MSADDPITVTMNYAEIGIWLRTNPELRAYLEDLGRRGVAYARSIAPVGDRATKTSTPGQYRDSLQYEVTEGKSRMGLRIFTTDYTAFWIEYGSKKMPRHAVLRRTVDYLATGTSRAGSAYAGISEYDAASSASRLRQRITQRRVRAAQASAKARGKL